MLKGSNATATSAFVGGACAIFLKHVTRQSDKLVKFHMAREIFASSEHTELLYTRCVRQQHDCLLPALYIAVS